MAAAIELVVDEILGRFKTKWDADAQTEGGLGYAPEILWEHDRREHGGENLAWARIYIRHGSVGPPTLGGPGTRRWCRNGSVYVNIFVPFADDGSGYTVAQRLAQVARDAYEGQRTDTAWFRACRITEMGRDGPWYQINMIADFEWDEVK